MPIKLFAPRGRSPYWTIRGTYLRVYVNRSTGTRDRRLAVKIKAKVERDIECGAVSNEAGPTFASAAAAYMKAGGERRFLRPLLEHFGEQSLRELGQTEIDAAAQSLYPGASPATRNRQVHTPISAILKRAGHRVDVRRPKGSGGAKATAWLWPEQAEAIFAEAEKLDPEFAALLIVLCYTGMRLSEALGLTWNDVRLQDGFAYVPDTKNGEPRAVFLPPVAVAALANLSGRDRGGTTFRLRKNGHLYALLKAVAFKAGVDLPERSAFHIFRHTYATWMRRYGGLDTRGLVGTGAWKDRKSAERYAHVVVSEEAERAAMLPTPKARTR